MKLDSLWTAVVVFFDTITFSSFGDRDASQAPLVVSLSSDGIESVESVKHIEHVDTTAGPIIEGQAVIIASGGGNDDGRVYFLDDGTPIIPTPDNPQDGGRPLECKYPDMANEGWENCHGPKNRSCWLRNPRTKQFIDINTDYEDPKKIPRGVVRKYNLVVGEQPIWPDKTTMEHGKVFNRSYPGPWIRACWGDTIEVEVTNNLKWNGTSVHWHGIRQLGTNQHDGVNGITECPIAPGDSFTYRFKAMQYGSAWYHSHYSLQYGDGMLGPMTIYGPQTANYDSNQHFKPILMTDWNHRSVFEDWPLMLESGHAPEMTNILLNGKGQFGPGSSAANKFQLTFTSGERHMLILINTAVDTTFIFMIDHHELEVIEMDFVPIVPYTTRELRVGIGQRYHVIVKGLDTPFDYRTDRNGNYWMRTIPAFKCSKFSFGPDEQLGIIRYNPKEKNSTQPLSEPGYVNKTCGDEPYDSLIPWRPWFVKDPVNIDPKWKNETEPAWNKRYVFDVHLTDIGGPGLPYIPDDKKYTRWSMHQAPFRINFSDPVVLKLDKTEEMIKQAHLDVITYDDKKEDQWIWMVLTAPEVPVDGSGDRLFVPAAHPMHLHGHDFALLAQSSWPWYDDTMPNGKTRRGSRHSLTPDKLNCKNPYVNCINPPRRDVVLLPAGGYVVIAFKADNPGAWIFHCHIAFHASSGLAIQILENKHLIDSQIAGDRKVMEESCKNWREWQNDPINHWDWRHPTHFQDDSGV